MSFGPKLEPLPATFSPNQEVVVSLEFAPPGEDFQRHLELYVEEPAGSRAIALTVKSAPREAHHDTPFPNRPIPARLDPD